MNDATTGETLCLPYNLVILERMEFPEPFNKVTVEPKTKADTEKRVRHKKTLVSCFHVSMKVMRLLSKAWEIYIWRSLWTE